MAGAPEPLRRGDAVPVDDIDNRPPSWRLPLALGAGIVLLGVSLWAWVGQLEGLATGDALPRIDLDSVAMMNVADAEAKLLKDGFIVNVKYLPSEGQPRGVVFAQDPVAGARVEQGDIVTLQVSDGQVGQAVPSVVGQQSPAAQALLVSNGFTVVVTGTPSETVAPGEVMSTTPEAGGRITLGGAVTLVVSSGPAARPVPDIMGKPLNDVMIALGRAKLGIGTITRTTKSDQPVGTVIGVDPPPGTPVARDFPIQLTVVDQPKPTVVPFVVGVRQATAEAALKANGLTSTVVVGVAGPGQGPGTVMAQSIPGGAPVPYGTSVQLTVAPGVPPPIPTTAPPTTVPPPTTAKPR